MRLEGDRPVDPGGEPERLQGFAVSADLFRVLGVEAAQGRTFLEEEDRPGNDRVVVISHELWQRRFGGAPDLVGKSIMLNGEPHTLAAPLTVSELLAQLGIDARRVAVEHNLVVVKRADYARTEVREGDQIEIVNFVGGGST